MCIVVEDEESRFFCGVVEFWKRSFDNAAGRACFALRCCSCAFKVTLGEDGRAFSAGADEKAEALPVE